MVFFKEHVFLDKGNGCIQEYGMESEFKRGIEADTMEQL